MNISKKQILCIMIVLLVLIAGGAVAYRGWLLYNENKAESEYKETSTFVKAPVLQETGEATEKTESSEAVEEDITEIFLNTGDNRKKYGYYLKNAVPDFDSLSEMNSDVIAFVTIPETEISYPILQNDDDAFYLKHSFSKNDNTFGAIYIENCNLPDFSDPVTVVYGHHLSNGSLFGKLTEYKNKEYCEANPYFIIYTKDSVNVYEIVTASKYSTDHLLISAFTEADDSGYREFVGISENLGPELVQKIKEYGGDKAYTTESEVTKDDKIVILSTCCDNSTRRFLVVGKKII